MVKRTKQLKAARHHAVTKRRPDLRRAHAPDERLPARSQWVAQPRCRRLCGDPNPATWWRWRQKPDFPKPKIVNGRVYFLWGDVADWWASQPEEHLAAA
jgi:hypothetical protein